ncbi:hypothetical protein KEM48_009225 [Puccinia striiformis f. sp. tritici PST-130]|nr:hypothetical protein KEM48_009225 [Puccinia striiformis f. sp. tritici PST-130]
MSPRQHFRRLASLFYAKKCLPKFIVGLTSTAIKTHHSPADASRQPTALVRKRCAEDFELPPKKSRRLIFMKFRIKMDCKQSNHLTRQLRMSTKIFCTTMRTGERTSARARITLQELSDANNGAVIWWGHSHFSELASLHSEIKVNSGEERDTIDGPEIAILERSLKSVQKTAFASKSFILMPTAASINDLVEKLLTLLLKDVPNDETIYAAEVSAMMVQQFDPAAMLKMLEFVIKLSVDGNNYPQWLWALESILGMATGKVKLLTTPGHTITDAECETLHLQQSSTLHCLVF